MELQVEREKTEKNKDKKKRRMDEGREGRSLLLILYTLGGIYSRFTVLKSPRDDTTLGTCKSTVDRL